MNPYLEWACLWLDAWHKWLSGLFSIPEIPSGETRARRRRVR